jgi:signal transduction histidine kinase
LLFGGWVAYLTADRARSNVRAAVAETARHVAERITAEIEKEVEVAQALATSTTLDAPNLSGFYREAARLTDARPLWDTVSLTKPDGEEVLNISRPFGTPLGAVADAKSFRDLVRRERPTIGSIEQIAGKPLVPLRVPVTRSANLNYVLTVGLVPSRISELLQAAGAPDTWIGAVVDGRGNIVARTREEKYEVARPASAAERSAIERGVERFYKGAVEGTSVESVYARMRGPADWSVHFSIPSKDLNAPVSRSIAFLSGGGLASLGLGAGLAWLIARDIGQRRRDEATRSALALRISEERGAVAIEAAALGVWRYDPARDEITGSGRFRALLGLAPLSADGGEYRWPARVALDGIDPRDRALVHEALRHCAERDLPLDVEFRAAGTEVGTRWVRMSGRRVAVESGSAVVHGVIADIEPKKRAEADRAALLRRLADTQEQEQRRIARELHDQVGQTITGLSLGLKGLERMLDTEGAGQEVRRQVQWLEALTSEIGRDIHRAALELRPTALDDLGLRQSLQAYASDWSARYGVVVDFQAVGSDERLASELETAIYRIVQEALTNVLKHAEATSVSIVLERRTRELRLVIEDDGRGFDPEQPVADDGRRPQLGISGMRERLALVGGTVRLESAAGVGTTLFVQVPLEREGA